LQPSVAEVTTPQGETYQTKNAHAVLTENGDPTGLVITPKVYRDKDDSPLQEDTSSWAVTHARSGKMVAGFYDTVEVAYDLAAKLSPLKWQDSLDGSVDTMAKLGKAQQIIRSHNNRLENKGGQG
jgi:hypothetical protein